MFFFNMAKCLSSKPFNFWLQYIRILHRQASQFLTWSHLGLLQMAWSGRRWLHSWHGSKSQLLVSISSASSQNARVVFFISPWVYPRKSLQNPMKSLQNPRKSLQNPRKSLHNPRKSLQNPRREFVLLCHGFSFWHETCFPKLLAAGVCCPQAGSILGRSGKPKNMMIWLW